MRSRVVHLVPTLLWVWLAASGCDIPLAKDVVNSYLLEPEKTCSELAIQLDLGDVPSASTPAELGLVFEPVTVASSNGQPINGWFVPAQWDGQIDADPAGTVLFMHGISGTVACTLPWVLVGVANHMNVVAFDYQGFGASGGTSDLATLLDDSDAVVSWIISDDAPARQRVHLLGHSLGTGPALGLATLRPRPQIESVAIEGSYDPIALADDAEQIVAGPNPPPVISVVMDLLRQSAEHQFAWLFEMRGRLGDMTIPAVFIHSQEDQKTPLSGAWTMFELAGSQAKSFWVFAGLGHAQPLFRKEHEYVSLLVSFWSHPAIHPTTTCGEGCVYPLSRMRDSGNDTP